MHSLGQDPTGIPKILSPELTGTDRLAEPSAQIRNLITDRFDGQLPDVVFSHAGGMYFSEGRDMHRMTSYSQLTEHGQATGGRLRVIATAEIAEAIPETKIIANSFNRFDPEEPTIASVIKSELVKRGVDPSRIETEESSFSTVTQLVEMVKLAVQNKWQRIVSITNEFHVPRTTTMFEMLDSIVDDAEFQETLTAFKEQGTEVQFITSEEVLRLVDARFTSYFEKVAQSEQYAHTVASEAKGLEDLKAGRYRIALTPENPR